MTMEIPAERFSQLVEKRLGLHFEEGKVDFLAEVLQRRLEVRGCSAEMYFCRIEAEQSSEGELAALASELTVAETYFFRNVDQFLERSASECFRN